MAELATIARPYAEALFKSVPEEPEKTSVWLDEIAALAGNAQLQQFADNPKVGASQVFDLMCGMVKTDLPAFAKNFLRTVIENGRLSVVPEMAAQYRALQNALGGTSDAVVYSAFPIDEAALVDLSATLERRFKRKLHLKVVLEPELIGGVRVVVGDEVLDTSVKSRLAQMKAALIA